MVKKVTLCSSLCPLFNSNWLTACAVKSYLKSTTKVLHVSHTWHYSCLKKSFSCYISTIYSSCHKSQLCALELKPPARHKSKYWFKSSPLKSLGCSFQRLAYKNKDIFYMQHFWALTSRATFQGEHILLHTKDMRFFGLVDPWENVPKMSSALSTSKWLDSPAANTTPPCSLF